MNVPKEIISVGLTWVRNKKEEQSFLQYINNAKEGNDANNETRHNRIEKVADGELLGIFRVESDDNLGVPF